LPQPRGVSSLPGYRQRVKAPPARQEGAHPESRRATATQRAPQ
jgi:hypothetical protein